MIFFNNFFSFAVFEESEFIFMLQFIVMQDFFRLFPILLSGWIFFKHFIQYDTKNFAQKKIGNKIEKKSSIEVDRSIKIDLWKKKCQLSPIFGKIHEKIILLKKRGKKSPLNTAF